jgi:cation-transporting ATPase 13A2
MDVINPPEVEENNRSYDNTIVFWVSNFQYVATCLAFSVSKPFRKSFYTNIHFTLSFAIITLMCIWIVFGQQYWIIEVFFLQEENMPLTFRYWIMVIVIANSIITYGFEKIVIW